MDRCSQCGFVYEDLPQSSITGALVEVARQYGPRLRGADPAALRRRPAPEVWSALEYTAHVRDVLRVQRERVLLALADDQPRFESMRREERVVELTYNRMDPAAVDAELQEAARSLASLFAGLSDTEWRRTGVYTWPSVASRDLRWMGRHTTHELVHHLFDIVRAVEPTPGSASG